MQKKFLFEEEFFTKIPIGYQNLRAYNSNANYEDSKPFELKRIEYYKNTNRVNLLKNLPAKMISKLFNEVPHENS